MTCQVGSRLAVMAKTRWLDESEMRAWLGYRRMQLLLNARVNRDLARDSGLSEPDYDVLSNLSAAPDRRGRLSELAARMLWSQSRLSHHISRMEQRGLVAREECESDGRGSVIALTEHGLRHTAESCARARDVGAPPRHRPAVAGADRGAGRHQRDGRRASRRVRGRGAVAVRSRPQPLSYQRMRTDRQRSATVRSPVTSTTAGRFHSHR